MEASEVRRLHETQLWSVAGLQLPIHSQQHLSLAALQVEHPSGSTSSTTCLFLMCLLGTVAPYSYSSSAMYGKVYTRECWPSVTSQHGLAVAPQVSPRSLTRLLQEATSLAGLQDLLQQHTHLVNDTHVVASLQWLLEHPEEQPQAPEQLAALVQQWVGRVAVDQLTARICASLAYCCSKLGYVEDLDMYRAVLQQMEMVLADANGLDVADLLYAFSSQGQLRGNSPSC